MRLASISPIGFLKGKKPEKNIKNNSNTLSETNLKGKPFSSNYASLSNAVCTDEFKPQTKTEYFKIGKDENGEKIYIPVEGTIISEFGKTKLAHGVNFDDFKGVAFKKNDDEIIQETHYLNGYPICVTDYKDGEEYKYTHFSHGTHKINQIYYFDGSFEISQKTASQNSSITTELRTLNENGEKIGVDVVATRKQGIEGSAECIIPTDDGYKTIALRWSYPNVKYSFEGSKEDARELKNMLQKLVQTINMPEYKKYFGKNIYFNMQLNDAIFYLSVIQ